MSRKGWIKLHRSLLDNPIWEKKPFTEGQAWIDILLLAETEEKDRRLKVSTIHQLPGNVYMSKKEMMDRWGWGRRTLDRVLAEWEKQDMISVRQIPYVHQSGHQNVHRTYTVITIEKWAFFQGAKPKHVHQNEHQNEQYLKNNKEVVGEALKAPSSDSGDVICYLDENGNWKVRM